MTWTRSYSSFSLSKSSRDSEEGADLSLLKVLNLKKQSGHPTFLSNSEGQRSKGSKKTLLSPRSFAKNKASKYGWTKNKTAYQPLLPVLKFLQQSAQSNKYFVSAIFSMNIFDSHELAKIYPDLKLFKIVIVIPTKMTLAGPCAGEPTRLRQAHGQGVFEVGRIPGR